MSTSSIFKASNSLEIFAAFCGSVKRRSTSSSTNCARSRLPIDAFTLARTHRFNLKFGLEPHELTQYQTANDAMVCVLAPHDITVCAFSCVSTMESFFSLLQKNVLDQQRWATKDELRIAIICWIEHKYHRQRRQSQLGKLAPIEYEILNNNKMKAA